MFYFDSTWLLLIPGLILSAIAQAKVSSAFKIYSKVPTKTGMTGADAARRLLSEHHLSTIQIEGVSGKLSDHYDPRAKVMRLSSEVGNQATIAAVSVAAHETGHAIQDAEGYWPLKFRNFIVPVCGFASNAAWPMFFVGLLLGNGSFGGLLMNLGIILFSVALVFYVITLPVEIDASRRAVKALKECEIILPGEEVGAKKMLTAAALTYVASMLMAFLNLIRMIALRDRRG